MLSATSLRDCAQTLRSPQTDHELFLAVEITMALDGDVMVVTEAGLLKGLALRMQAGFAVSLVHLAVNARPLSAAWDSPASARPVARAVRPAS